MCNWQRRSDLRDPLEQLIQRENATCSGCLHLGATWGQPWCLKKDIPATSHGELRQKCGYKKETV